MARRPTTGPTERELEILDVFWRNGRCSVREVHQTLSESEDISFTSIQTMLQIMFEKGLVWRELQGRSYTYCARESQEDTQRALLANLLEKAFGGSAKALVSRALDVRRASTEELDEIQTLLNEARKGNDV